MFLTQHQQYGQHTQIICITLIQRRPNVFDVGPTLYKCYTNVLLGVINPVSAEHYYIVIFNLFYKQVKSQLLGMKWLSKHQHLQMFGLKLNTYE